MVRLVFAALLGRQRSFREDARACVARLTPPLVVHGEANIPIAGPCVLTINHYTRPGFGAWWLAFAVSAALPVEVHWVFTAEWTYPDRLRRQFITPATRWLFQKFAGVYGFTTMPAMPPDPRDVARRARAVRQVLNYARRAQAPLIGLAPEGMDFETGGLGMPPTGAGRFILHLNDLGLLLSPVGVYEAEDRLCVHFGPPYSLEIPAGLAAAGRDRAASQAVMRSIAALLPEYLRGEFG